MTKDSITYQPFVILGTARTGTTMLWSYLNSHPEILCLRGVFGSRDKINFGKFYTDLPEEYHSEKLIQFRNDNPTAFLEKYVFKKYATQYKAVGFKYFYDHDRHLANRGAIIDYFHSNNQLKFIHIKRDNLLAVYFSYKRSLSQNRWTDAISGYKTIITIQELSDYFKFTTENQKLYDGLFPKQILQVHYDSLLIQEDCILNEIMDFIGVKKMKLYSETQKNDNIKYSDFIENYSQLKKYFSNTVYAKYFDE